MNSKQVTLGERRSWSTSALVILDWKITKTKPVQIDNYVSCLSNMLQHQASYLQKGIR